MQSQTSEAPADILIPGKWRNLAYDKDGKTYRGQMTHTSQEAAIAAIKYMEGEIRKFGDRAFPIFTLDGALISVDYSYAVPLPVD